MKILFLTQYFPPETGAPQNRLLNLALELKSHGHEVSILTAMPNYPKGEVFDEYKGKALLKEENYGLTIHRTFIYATPSKKIIPRLLNYFSFVFTSLAYGLMNISKQDVIICESPPLFLGISALILKWAKGAKLLFNVSDLWPESAEKLGIVNNPLMLQLAYGLEKLIYRNSEMISGQTKGIVESISSRMDRDDVFLLRNGIDFSAFRLPENNNWRSEQGFSSDDFLLGYAGIIGHAQGLEVVIKAADKLKVYPQIKFLIVGDGPEKAGLIRMVDELQLQNVFFFPNMPWSMIPSVVSSFDAGIIPLKKLDIFKGAIPSKIFELLALKKPALLGIEGEAFDLFVKEGHCALFFEPENAVDLALQILKFYNDRALATEMGERGYQYVKEYFDRKNIASGFNEYISPSFNSSTN